MASFKNTFCLRKYYSPLSYHDNKYALNGVTIFRKRYVRPITNYLWTNKCWFRGAIPTKIGRSISKTLYLTFLTRTLVKIELSKLKPSKTLKKFKILLIFADVNKIFAFFALFLLLIETPTSYYHSYWVWAISLLFLKFYDYVCWPMYFGKIRVCRVSVL